LSDTYHIKLNPAPDKPMYLLQDIHSRYKHPMNGE